MRHRLLVGLGVVVFLLAAGGMSIFADTLTFTNCGVQQSDPTTSSCSVSVNNAQSIGSLSASATAAYGTLGAYASATADGLPIASSAQAQFTDSLTFSGFTGDAFLQLTTGLEGTASVTGTAAGASWILQTDLGIANAQTQECAVSDNTNPSVGPCTVLIAITPDSVVDMSMFLAVSVQAGGGGSATADFIHTGKVDGLLIVDSSGNAISGADIISASGTTYPTGLSTVPEPSSMLLLGVSSLGLLGLTRKKIHA